MTIMTHRPPSTGNELEITDWWLTGVSTPRERHLIWEWERPTLTAARGSHPSQSNLFINQAGGELNILLLHVKEDYCIFIFTYRQHETLLIHYWQMIWYLIFVIYDLECSLMEYIFCLRVQRMAVKLEM